MFKKKDSSVHLDSTAPPPGIPGKKGLWLGPAILAGIVILVLGGVVWGLIILCGGLAAGTSWGVIALRRDIKLRLQYEKQLKEMNEQLRAGIDNMPNAYILVDNRYRVTEWNRKAEQIFGYTREEMLGKKPIDYIVPPHIRQTLQGKLEKQEEGKRASYTGKDNNIRKDGTLITCLWSDTPLTDREGKLYGILSMAQDITVQKEAEEKIRLQNEFLYNAIDSLTHPFYVINADDYTVELANSAVAKKRLPQNMTCYALTHKRNSPCDFPGHICPLEEIKKTKKPFTTVHLHYDREGKEIYSEIHGYPIFNRDGNVEKIIEYSLDITERRRNDEERRKLADQLRHAQKMEAIGTLAGGVAHEFNNILGAIIGYTELAADETPPDTPTHQYLSQVLVASDRAREMVKQILAFSRKDEMERKPVLLSDIVKETHKLLKSILPASIAIRPRIDKKLKPIMANSTEIHQVLMNLCTNAAHAMKTNGGILEIVLNEIDFDNAPIDIKEPKHGRYQQLTVSDTGHGMTPKIKSRVFEPYFTTREQGEGTGMGLAVVHGIVTRHGGEITVDSEPGKGTAFHVFLPVTDSEHHPQTEEIKPAVGGNERILYVDDEVLLSEMGKQILEKLGYKVEAHTAAGDALESFRRNPGTFDLVITDQTMPEMDGLRFANELREIRPGIPIILCTGFSEAVDEENFKSRGIDAFVMKPVVKNDIAHIIRKVLGEEKTHD